ncbi:MULTISPECIES: ABC transporter permease [unclassified Brenneria]|uniref:ABC transporter permease n=1 Tax=unclassified Brenneria TaxID=2634434 RepID=UPI001557BA12|nr:MULTISPECIES: ABC transporter permease subunit [unclassified Brenneria]MBJ7221275.1 ABC transporter permease subunit [Brenneria sp. L3-3C-1]MEE3642519.1 ABC transporter permease subunit [Brenneria sp. L3_3C_1]MEE3650108.1 ABC transporter permease subunit [Brenneria sp. HEZEL_4_2_4]NPD00067.1 ABC transporter permease subunit [Brenneria sp. hezel4-2-4]
MRFDWLWRQSDQILQLFLWHVWLSVVPVLLGLVLAIPVGQMIQSLPRLKSLILNLFGLLYTIPSLALFVLLPGILGTRILDTINVVAALTIYAFALLVRTVCDGLDAVSPDTRQAALALGYKPFQQFLAVDLPIAVPVIAAGLRVVVVSNVSIVSIAALVGAPQLGSLFTQGFQLHFLTPIIAGIVLCILLALLLDNLLLLLTRRLAAWQPKRSST